ncbi:MAG: translational machinery protein [Alphaproteobacteria bacterium]
MSHFHAVVWLDHREARVFHFNADAAEKETLRPHDRHPHLHHRAGTLGAGKQAADRDYLQSIVDAVSEAGEIAVFGPGSAKSELMAHMRARVPTVAEKVVHVETVDHPTDRQIVAQARRYFRHADRLTPQRPS